MKQLNQNGNQRVIRDLDGVPNLIKWIFDSREENRAQMEQETERDEILRLQGENRVLNIMLDKIPKDG